MTSATGPGAAGSRGAAARSGRGRIALPPDRRGAAGMVAPFTALVKKISREWMGQRRWTEICAARSLFERRGNGDLALQFMIAGRGATSSSLAAMMTEGNLRLAHAETRFSKFCNRLLLYGDDGCLSEVRVGGAFDSGYGPNDAIGWSRSLESLFHLHFMEPIYIAPCTPPPLLLWP
jgi:hypothetical protein